MERDIFALSLRQAILASWTEFLVQHANETAYALALIPGQMGHSLGYAIATEERLLRVAEKYQAEGWRYDAAEWEIFEDRQKIAEWLRWANPDDGWHFGDFPDHFEIPETLDALVEDGAFGEDVHDLEEFCTHVLAQLRSDIPADMILGVTWGEDPRDFLRTATRINGYSNVTELWQAMSISQALEGRIIPPN
jgi:hypothetical protein